MTRRDTEKDLGAHTDPGAGAVVNDAVEGLDAPPPAYSFERAQSDMADAAHHHVPARVPPAPQDVSVDRGGVEIASTKPGLGPAPKGPITERMEAVRSEPSHTNLGEDLAHLEALRRGPPLGGVTTDPSARKQTERRNALVVLAAVLALAFITAFVIKRAQEPKEPTRSPATARTTEATSASARATLPSVEVAPPPPPPPPSSASTVAPVRTARPLSTAPPIATSAPPTTTAKPTTNESFNPLIEHDY